MTEQLNDALHAGTVNPEEGTEKTALDSGSVNTSAPLAGENENSTVTVISEVEETGEGPIQSSETVIIEDDERSAEEAQRKAGASLVEEILKSEEDFEAMVEHATARELTFLMNRFAEEDDVRQLISRFPTVKKAFDKAIQAETEEEAEKLRSKFHTSLARFNHKRAEAEAEIEKERAENSKKKSELLDQLKEIVLADKVSAIQEVRDIQAKWKEIGWVKQEDREPFNERYKHYLDKFYGLREMHHELLEMDRKHNLEEKLRMIQQIEGFIPAGNDLTRESWKAVSEMIKSLQEIWRTIGPVPRDETDKVNEAYKKALDDFYAKRSSYYELQDEERKVNSEKKTALLEEMRPFREFLTDKIKEWTDATDKLLALQEQWKEIGPGTSEVNKNFWKEYREIFDQFFRNKSSFFDKIREERNRNLNLKMGIIERAEALMNSQNWKETAREMKRLQDEWKTVGPIPDRISQKIWKRFRKACDTFFDARGEALKSAGMDQDQNLKAKQQLIADIQALMEDAERSDSDKVSEFHEIQERWRNTGHVPFEKKDEVNIAFREASIAFEKKHNIGYGAMRYSTGGGQGRRSETQELAANTPEEKLKAEMNKLKEKMELAQKKLNTYESNIMMVAKGKSGDSLRAQIQTQIDAEKSRVEELKVQVKELRVEMEKQKKAAQEAAEAAAKAAAEAAAAGTGAETPAGEPA